MKAKWMVWLVLFVFCASVANATKVKGNGKVVSKEYPVSDYKDVAVGISYNGSGDKRIPTFNYMQKSGSSSLQITTDENLLPLLEVSTSEGKLTIKVKDGSVLQPTKLVINGHSAVLEKVKTSGGMDFIFANDFSGDKLEVKASGASDVYMKYAVQVRELEINASGASDLTAQNVVCGKIGVSASGASDVTLKGKAEEGEYKASGSSDISAYGMIVKNLECKASGSSDIQAYASGVLNASASGSSDILYKGNPKAEVHASSSSDIVPVR